MYSLICDSHTLTIAEELAAFSGWGAAVLSDCAWGHDGVGGSREAC